MILGVKTSRGKHWSSHNEMLIRVLLNSKGDVLELGAGLFSTPLLHWFCKIQSRRLYTYENETLIYDFAKTFQSKSHRIRFIDNWDNLATNHHWGIILVDHHPEARRSVDVLRFKDTADYIIIHDTERDDKYTGITKAIDTFKYRYTWKDCKPWTTVVSNFKDLKNLEE